MAENRIIPYCGLQARQALLHPEAVLGSIAGTDVHELMSRAVVQTT